jgi:hypothetical protein
MPAIACQVDGCVYVTDDVATAIALLNSHVINHRATPVDGLSADTRHRGPKLERPKIQLNATTEDWNNFIRHWDIYRSGSGIDEASAPGQLLE